MSSFTIYVAGDPIYDEYTVEDVYPTRFSDTRSFYRHGGAANVLNNIRALASPDVQVISLVEPNVLYWPRIERRVDQPSGTVRTVRKTHRELDPPSLEQIQLIKAVRSGIVLADYNKGSLNTRLCVRAHSLLASKTRFEFLVLDSKHASYWADYLQFARMKVLHCTGEEINKHNLSQFNYVLHTDGANPIRIYQWGGLIASIPVPPCEDMVDTIGAGDTFTASIACYMASHCNQAWDFGFFINAVEYAIPYCQQVIRELGVCVPNSI